MRGEAKSAVFSRPAYMDEYERLEEDLQKLYDAYTERFRNLAFLEQQLDDHNRVEHDRLEVGSNSYFILLVRLRCVDVSQQFFCFIG